METPVIEAKGLNKRYGDTVAVAGIDFAVARGATAALLGGNGAGKTTTLAMLLGLVVPTARQHPRSRRGHAAPPLPRPGADEFLVALYRPAASPDGAAEPRDLWPALWRARSSPARRRARPRSAARAVPRPPDRQAQFGPAHAGGAGQGAGQRARAAAARRADRVARPRYRRLGAGISRDLPRAHRRHDPARLAQHGSRSSGCATR